MVSRWEWCADYDATTRNKYKYKFKWNRKAGIGANLQRTDVNGYSDDDGSIHDKYQSIMPNIITTSLIVSYDLTTSVSFVVKKQWIVSYHRVDIKFAAVIVVII